MAFNQALFDTLHPSDAGEKRKARRRKVDMRSLPDKVFGTCTIWRDALRQIRDYPVNGNSEPDMMATAIDAMQRLARAAVGDE